MFDLGKAFNSLDGPSWMIRPREAEVKDMIETGNKAPLDFCSKTVYCNRRADLASEATFSTFIGTETQLATGIN